MRAIVGHLEIPARDPERMGRFLRAAFGWRLEAVDWNGPVYLKFRTPDEGAASALQGGVMDAEAADFDHPLPVIHLLDGSIHDCLVGIEAAGGRVLETARRIGDMGDFARFEDPEGHQWGLWMAANNPSTG